jgi:hypothetical protein
MIFTKGDSPFKRRWVRIVVRRKVRKAVHTVIASLRFFLLSPAMAMKIAPIKGKKTERTMKKSDTNPTM